ncbi:MAG: hypothetical protein II464_02030 [Oscillospiraceae bacterium]|nr:hypothetical protein [Oscillospiraceae bacterium]
MKTYEQMAHDALRRIEEYENLRRERRKAFNRAAVPALSFCIVALLGIGLWKSGVLDKKNVEVIQPQGQQTQSEISQPVPEPAPPSTEPDPQPSNGGMEQFSPAQPACEGVPPVTENGDPSHVTEDPAPGPPEISGEVTKPEPEPGITENSEGEGGAVVHGPNQPVGEEPAVYTPAYRLIEDYPEAPSASYATPEMGQTGRSVPLMAAIEHYRGEAVRYRVVVDFFEGDQPIRDKDILLAEANRLYAQGGYTAGVETVRNSEREFSYLFLIATEEEILSFPARSDRGYFMFLIKEYPELTD